MTALELSAYPTKGNRRELDKAWLRTLHREGLAGIIDVAPVAPGELNEAIEEFNLGQYWQCHETLEAIWLPERYPLRLFYHGLIKAAVGLLHLQRRNRHGALVKLSDAQYTLSPFPSQYMGIDTANLVKEIGHRLELVKVEPPAEWEAIEKLLAVRIQRLEQR